MSAPARVARQSGVPFVVSCALLSGLVSLSGCASKKTMYAEEDGFYDGAISAREYGYVRPATDVRVLGSDRSGARVGGDLWTRVRAGMKLDRYASARIDRQVEAMRRNPQYLTTLSQRARPYLHVVIDEIDRRGLPAELALLAHVESRYNPGATSPMAAAGIWQFIPSTGRIMGLRQDDWYDGRRDVLASTRAAMDYLTLLNRRFGGSWELAMAAYNCGPGRVESAQTANRRSGRPTDFWSLSLPGETMAYVPQVLAAARLVAEPAKYGLRLPPVPTAPQLELVRSERPVDLFQVAQATGVSLAELQRLNPGLKRGQTAPGAGHLLVPAGSGQRIGASLGKARVIPASASAIVLSQSPTVAAIGVPAPARAVAVSPAPGTLSESQPERARGPERLRVVKTGESLRSIAKAEGMDIDELAEHNAMTATEPLLPGQSLRIPGTTRSSVAAGEAASLVTYRVRRGDSIGAIARRYGVTVAEIKRWNPASAGALRSGETLRIYRSGEDA